MNCPYCNQLALPIGSIKCWSCLTCAFQPTWANWDFLVNSFPIMDLYMEFYCPNYQIHFYPNSNRLTIIYQQHIITIPCPFVITPNNVQQIADRLLKMKAFL